MVVKPVMEVSNSTNERRTSHRFHPYRRSPVPESSRTNEEQFKDESDEELSNQDRARREEKGKAQVLFIENKEESEEEELPHRQIRNGDMVFEGELYGITNAPDIHQQRLFSTRMTRKDRIIKKVSATNRFFCSCFQSFTFRGLALGTN